MPDSGIYAHAEYQLQQSVRIRLGLTGSIPSRRRSVCRRSCRWPVGSRPDFPATLRRGHPPCHRAGSFRARPVRRSRSNRCPRDGAGVGGETVGPRRWTRRGCRWPDRSPTPRCPRTDVVVRMRAVDVVRRRDRTEHSVVAVTGWGGADEGGADEGGADEGERMREKRMTRDRDARPDEPIVVMYAVGRRGYVRRRRTSYSTRPDSGIRLRGESQVRTPPLGRKGLAD